MRKTRKTMKRIVSVLLALAMVITSISYTPEMASAADTTVKANGFTYAIHGVDAGGITGFEQNSTDEQHFTFAWAPIEGSVQQVNVEIKDSGSDVKKRIENQSNGFTIEPGELQELGIGEYTMTFTEVGGERNASAQLTISKDETSEPGPEQPADKNSQTITAEDIAAVENVALYGFEQSKSGYKVVFDDPNGFTDEKKFEMVDGDTVAYKVYVNDGEAATVNASGEKIDYSTISDLGLQEGNTNTVSVQPVLTRKTADNDTETLEGPKSDSVTFVYNTQDAVPQDEIKDTGIPKVYVDTLDDSAEAEADTDNVLRSGDKKDHQSVITITDASGTVDSEDFGTIKLRGNSTAGANKKPYNIKFNSKQNVFGYGKAKKWSLLANAFDKSLLRNQIAMSFMRELESSQPSNHQYSSQCQTVDLYIDRHFIGTYLLIESVEAGADRVNIDAENSDNLDMLIELNANAHDWDDEGLLEDDYSTTGDNRDTTLAYPFTINEPERPGPNSEKLENWNNSYETKRQKVVEYLKRFESALDIHKDNTDTNGQNID